MIHTISGARWTPSSEIARGAEEMLESGAVVFFPELAFAVNSAELSAFAPSLAGRAKNVSFDPATGRLGGASLDEGAGRTLGELLRRFSGQAAALVGDLLPRYRTGVQMGRTSFRPVEISGRQTSWRKDDTRLHVDSFPATPVNGRRILRVFSNVNPSGRPRTWRLGDQFEAVARRFAPSLRLPFPGTGTMLRWLRVTKTKRSPYDALMLQLHDRMKADADFQANVPQTSMAFPAGSTWMAFTDQVSHAAMAGQYQLEQTFLLPVNAMLDERRSPLRILEALTGRSLLS